MRKKNCSITIIVLSKFKKGGKLIIKKDTTFTIFNDIWTRSNCSANNSCKLGRATIIIKEK